jgi:ribose 5-phosphate isomerase B
MKIFVGADHAGFGLKTQLIPYLESLGYEVIDKGALEYNEIDDYPDFIVPVAREVALHPNEVRGVILGGSGQGEAMCANRFKFVRAAVYYGNAHSIVDEPESILKRTRQHNDANVLSLGARYITADDMKTAVKEWLETPFAPEDRHDRRVSKMDHLHE